MLFPNTMYALNYLNIVCKEHWFNTLVNKFILGMMTTKRQTKDLDN